MPGRDQLGPMQRVVRIMALLDDAGSRGTSGERLIAVAGYGDADPGTQLNRELAHLRAQGWRIDNVAGPGEPALYRMVSGDNRLRLALTTAQVAALQRAVILADRGDLARRLGLAEDAIPAGVGAPVVAHETGPGLSGALEAVRRRSRLRFSYKGVARTVHPAAVRFERGAWYLTGYEEDAAGARSSSLKHFVVGRMSAVVPDPPGSAEVVVADRTAPQHPLQWEVDPPVEVVLRTEPDYVPDVLWLLRAPRHAEEHDGVVDLTYSVTHRAALRARLYALGRRITVVSPDEVREELLDELREMAGH
ncbi:helix-turn-helix transcriptional regulator [Nocardioides litoris]|uniref:helix-turn-helix transcriptional regulator n=1 Tax=Nocardioides litoris TaxID=1926648 RepID=UPI00111F5FCB|nr:WYL domain-containing protein [Nocardioides litoris]